MRTFTLLTLIATGCSSNLAYQTVDAGSPCGSAIPSAVEEYPINLDGPFSLLVDGDQLLVGTFDGLFPVGPIPCSGDMQPAVTGDPQTVLAEDATSIYTAPLDVTNIGSGASQASEFPTSIAAIDKASGMKQVLVTGSDPITTLAVDGHTLWFGTGSDGAGTLSSMPIAGGNPTRVLSMSASPWNLAIGTDYVFMADGTQVTAVPKAGGDAIVLATSTNQPCHLALADNWVYVVERGAGPGDRCVPGPSGGAISRVAQPPPFATPATWPTTTLQPVVADTDQPLDLVSDATNLYWTSFTGLKRAPLAGGTSETLVATSVDAIVQTDRVIYASWGGNNGQLFIVPK